MDTPQTQCTIKDLRRAFAQADMPVSRMWVYRQEAKGNLILPRSTTDFKKVAGRGKASPVRVLTQKDIEGILHAFLPGGTGYYDYRKHRP